MQWIREQFGDGNMGTSGWYMWIETDNPPKPVPLTVGCMPVMFIGIGEELKQPIPRTNLSNPRVADPCLNIRLPVMAFPTKEQNIAVLTSLEPLANMRAIMYMPYWTIVELEFGDGRTYELGSLPGTVAGRTTLYHHDKEPFFNSMKNMTRARRIDPSQHQTAGLGPMPQDDYNYFKPTTYLSPGCRVESGYGDPGSRNESVNAANIGRS
jgi:hypothetical protein